MKAQIQDDWTRCPNTEYRYYLHNVRELKEDFLYHFVGYLHHKTTYACIKVMWRKPKRPTEISGGPIFALYVKCSKCNEPIIKLIKRAGFSHHLAICGSMKISALATNFGRWSKR